MATPEQVKKWFKDDLDDAGRAKVVAAEEKGTGAAKSVKGMLLQADLIEPTATDGQVIDTLKMRH
jgi:hypothetical protein